ncbi:hypothetical protein [Streptomyces sp. NPDC059816]|uniref:hypothetical protein n=1 Tax=Streptomyces sp. NPDC059816 TaxID=3346960 RepID=UPI00364F199C
MARPVGQLGRGARGVRGALAAGAALCAVAAVSAPGTAAADGRPPSYTFDEDAQRVEGALDTTRALRLTPGKTYRSTVPRAGKLYYRLELGARESAYVSATVVPTTGAKVSFKDGYSIAVQDDNGINCSADRARFGSSTSPRPLTAWAARRAGASTLSCKRAGTYYVVVERQSEEASPRDPWDLELRFSMEPALRGPAPSATPTGWPSEPPAPLTGTPKEREGGTGFSAAPRLDQGVWRDRIRPGQTLYYWVPVDWGQQLTAEVELGSATAGGSGGGGRGLGRYVPSALGVSLFNPARGPVDQTQSTYDGRQKKAVIGPLPPVRYENRYAVSDEVSGVRFGGRYYLAVHLSRAVAERFGDGPLGLTLRVRVQGDPGAGGSQSTYDGQPLPVDEFEVVDAAEPVRREGGGGTGTGFARGPVMKTVAAGAFTAGTALVLLLVVWTVVARRRAAGGKGAGRAGTDGDPEAGAEAGTESRVRSGR